MRTRHKMVICFNCGSDKYYIDRFNENEYNIVCGKCNTVIDFYSYGILDSENVNVLTHMKLYINILKYNIKKMVGWLYG